MPASKLYNNNEFQKGLLDVITKNIFDFIAVIKKDDRKIVFVNQRGAKMFEYETTSELLGKYAPSLWKNIPGEDKLNEIDNEIHSKGYFSDEIEYITKNGTPFWGMMQRSPFSVDGVDYQLLQIEKIDRAKVAEESLLKEKQRFGALMDYASIGVIIVNQEQQIILMNSFALQLFGYKISELKGRKIEILIPARFHKKHPVHQQYFYENSTSRPMGTGLDLFAIKKDGSEFPVEISLGTYKTENETYVISFITDITIRKKAEQEIIKLNADLEKKVKDRTDELAVTISKLEEQVKKTESAKTKLVEVTEFQKAVLNFSGAMIIATDPQGIITLFNHAAEQLLGYKAEEIVGKHNPGLFHLKEETEERASQFSKELQKEIVPGFETYIVKSREDMLNKHEWNYVKKSGERFPVSLTITALRNKKNEIIGFLGVAVDISEIKKTEEELKKSLEIEKELSVLKSRFVSIASHEFRTPLSAILSSVYLIQRYSNPDDIIKREKHIGRIVSSVNILTGILNDFLSVGKIEEGKTTPKITKFNICEHIETIINETKEIKKNGQQIIYRHSGDNEVSLDATLLRHIVINLLSNSIKFSPEESDIFIETNIGSAIFELHVKDHGIGIPKEDQEHLFERFFRGGNATGIQGTGLGLHIIQKYVELMNGKVDCFSEPQKETHFTVRIEMPDSALTRELAYDSKLIRKDI